MSVCSISETQLFSHCSPQHHISIKHDQSTRSNILKNQVDDNLTFFVLHTWQLTTDNLWLVEWHWCVSICDVLVVLSTLSFSLSSSVQLTSQGGLAYPDDGQVQRCAAQCLKLFDANPTSSGSTHIQSRRFLAGDWNGLHDDPEKDPPLRGLVEALASGDTTMLDISKGKTSAEVSFIGWVSSFCLVTWSIWYVLEVGILILILINNYSKIQVDWHLGRILTSWVLRSG